jgi:hypothetical protein
MPIIYPKLLNLKSQQKNIYCVAGDIGVSENEFYIEDKNGIHFYATGLSRKSKLIIL